MLKSRLTAIKYTAVPATEISKYVTVSPGIDINLIDPILLGRLAMFAKMEGKGKKININSGTRTITKQAELFLARGGKKDAKGIYFWPEAIPANKRTVAKPGKSFHNYGLAIDTDSLWAKAINKTEATAKQLVLLKYGLFKPMTAGNKSALLEDWHIQVIETLNVPLEKRAGLAPIGLALK